MDCASSPSDRAAAARLLPIRAAYQVRMEFWRATALCSCLAAAGYLPTQAAGAVAALTLVWLLPSALFLSLTSALVDRLARHLFMGALLGQALCVAGFVAAFNGGSDPAAGRRLGLPGHSLRRAHMSRPHRRPRHAAPGHHAR